MVVKYSEKTFVHSFINIKQIPCNIVMSFQGRVDKTAAQLLIMVLLRAVQRKMINVN